MNHQNNKNNAEIPARAEVPREPVITIGLSMLAIAFISIFTLALVNTENASLARTAPAQFAAATYAESAPNIAARAAIVYDVTRDTVLYERNMNAQLPLASLTKVLLALVAVRELTPETTIFITKEALATEGDTGLRVGERWKLQDLIDATLIPSSNDGAEALALAIGKGSVPRAVLAMNTFARDIGLANAFFLNPTGLDESDTMAGAYGSARDMARMFAYSLKNHPSLLDGTAQGGMLITSESGIEHTAINTNEALGQIPGLIAGKTGATILAGGNLAVAFDADIGRPIVVVALGSTASGRFDDVRALVRYARGSLQK